VDDRPLIASCLGALIRDRRRQLGLDQKTLARSAGVSRYWIMDIESGKATAAIGHVLRTLRSLDMVVDVREAPAAATRKPGRTAASRRVDVDALIKAALVKRRRT
jgi:y4mF family transcriptional regulator